MSVVEKVQQARAIAWYIDQRLADGKSDDEIARELPVAIAFITGRIGLEDLPLAGDG